MYSERENSFDSNYYVDFCILKSVALLVKSPRIVLGAFVATVDRDRRPWAYLHSELHKGAVFNFTISLVTVDRF